MTTISPMEFCFRFMAAIVLCVVCVIAFITYKSSHSCDNFPTDITTESAKSFSQYPTPPKPDDVACMARYIVHQSNWCSLSYISQRGNITGYPASRIYSISDGSLDTTTGDIYFMVSPMDETVADMFKNNACSITMTLDQDGYCTEHKLDTEDPRCAQAGFTGRFTQLDKNSAEWNIAKTALWSRHPVMKEWWYIVPGHNFFFAKLSIQHIYVVDKFGGRKFPAISDYYNATGCLKQL